MCCYHHYHIKTMGYLKPHHHNDIIVGLMSSFIMTMTYDSFSCNNIYSKPSVPCMQTKLYTHIYCKFIHCIVYMLS